jgi:uncharacterized protein YciI
MKHRLFFIFVLLLTFSTSAFAADSLRYYFVFLNPNPNLQQIGDSAYTEIQRKHLEDMTRLHESGFLVAAGPFEGGGGVFIVRASTVKAVNDSMNTDASVMASRSVAEILPMNIYRGKLCEGDGDDMRSYEALRLNNIRLGQKDMTPEKIREQIDGWIANAEKQGKVLFVCTLGCDIPESVFIVADITEKKRVATKHYQPKEPGAFIAIMKNFFLAHGTFCETD